MGIFSCEARRGAEIGDRSAALGGAETFVPPAPWLNENLNGYALGRLDGQGGWTLPAGSQSVTLVGDMDCPRMAALDPSAGQAAATKDVPDQASGIHLVEFDVKIDTLIEDPSVGKFVVHGNVGGDGIKFQFIAGTGLRVAWGQQPDQALVLVGLLKPHRFYHVRAEVTLPNGTLNVYVDGQLANDTPITPRPGAITAVSLVGFAPPGVPYFDNMYGAPTRGATWVNIDSPAPSTTVTGSVPIAVSVSPDVTSVELYIEGEPKETDTTFPFGFSWNSAENPLIPPNPPGHHIAYAYYYVDGRYGEHRGDVNHYTDGYHAWARLGYIENAEEPPLGPWVAKMAQALLDAASQGRRITLAFNLQDSLSNQPAVIDKVIEIAAPVWSSIERIEVADEPPWDMAHAQQVIADLEARIAAFPTPLAPKPMGIVYSYQDPYPTSIFASNLDWLGIETYRDAPGHPESQVNIDGLRAQIASSMSQVPAGKTVVFVPQAYTRNSCWGNIDNVRDLQAPTYLAGAADGRVLAMNMFAYARNNPFKPTSTLQNPELREPHLLAGELILERTIRSARRGLRTISVKAIGAGGTVAWARRVVTVNGPIIHAPLSVPGNTPGLLARVIRKPSNAANAWTMTGGTITAGATTQEITYTSGAPGTAMELVLNESYFGARQSRQKVLADFNDVPHTHLFHDYIANVALNGITGGCGGGNFCPNQGTTREQMAVFLLVAKEGTGYLPPAATGTVFNDVPATSPFARWIEELHRRGVVGGCSTNPPLYCPTATVTRDTMAVFLLKTLEGPAYLPPPATGTVFNDVPASNPFARWIEELVRRGITGGCGNNDYCPGNPVTRGQLAVFLVKTFGLAYP